MNAKEETANQDTTLAKHIKETEDMENAVGKLQMAIITACDKTFKTQSNINKTTKYKSVPWWTADLTIQRKRLNALRRCYQRTKNDEGLREQCKNKYFEERKDYQRTIKKEKNSIVEKLLQFDNTYKPLECNIQNSSK